MSRAAAAPAPPIPTALPLTYFQHAKRPWPSLLFIIPLIILYEFAARQTDTPILAFSLMRQFYGLFKANAHALPAITVVGAVLACHIARREFLVIPPSVLAVMILESMALGAPLIILSLATNYYSLAAGVDLLRSMGSSVGAGVYEEFLFRAVALTLLSLLLIDVGKMRRFPATLLIVAVPAILFSGYHYLGQERFIWREFVFRTLAGIYFGALFLLRGIGVTTGSHIVYDFVYCLYASSG